MKRAMLFILATVACLSSYADKAYTMTLTDENRVIRHFE